MITRLELRDYLAFREAMIDLRPLTVLVGPNASGKTSALKVLHRLAEDRPPSVEGLLRKGGIQFQVRYRSGKGTFTFIPPDDARAANQWMDGRTNLPPVISLDLDPDQLRAPSYLEASQRMRYPGGFGLPTILADMKLLDDQRFDWISEQVSKVIPTFRGVRFVRVEVDLDSKLSGHGLVFDMKGAAGIPADSISDGTILVLGIVAGIVDTVGTMEEDGTLLVLIDDIERGLHPRALGEFIGCLRQMTEEMPIQIMATSHSPYLLDFLRPEEVRLTGFREDGTATVANLTDHPEFDKWKDVMTPGEFWATAGEDWIRDVAS